MVQRGGPSPDACKKPPIDSGEYTRSFQRIDVLFLQQPFQSHDVEMVVDAEYDYRF